MGSFSKTRAADISLIDNVEPIRVMNISPRSTNYVNFPEIYESVVAAAAAINAAGGIGGRPILTEWGNESADRHAVEACAKKAVKEGFTAVVGNYIGFDNASYDILRENNIPSIAPIGLTAPDFIDPAAYPLISIALVGFLGVGYQIKQDGHQSVAVIGYEGPSSQKSLKYFVAGIESWGVKLARFIPLQPGAEDISTQVKAALDSGASAICSIAGANDVCRLIRGVRGSGSNVPYYNTAIAVLPAIDTLGEAGNELTLISTFPAPGSPESKDYMTEWEKFAAPNMVRSDFTVNAWLGMHLLANVASKLKVVDGKSIQDVLNHSTEITFSFLKGYQPNGVPPIKEFPRLKRIRIYANRVRNGKLAESLYPRGANPVSPKFRL